MKTINELEKIIAEKNYILKTLKKSPWKNREEIRKVQAELDKVLYSYYKLLICKGNPTMAACPV